MMRHWLSPFIAGALFAIGLMLSGMTQPHKVVGFLDFGGNWDPSLAFVMVGALAVYASLQSRIRARPQPFWAQMFQVPERRDLDGKLVVGAALFGVGWGLAGYCPGPALTSLFHGGQVVLFVAAMAFGMWTHNRLMGPKSASSQGEAQASGATQTLPEGARVDG